MFCDYDIVVCHRENGMVEMSLWSDRHCALKVLSNAFETQRVHRLSTCVHYHPRMHRALSRGQENGSFPRAHETSCVPSPMPRSVTCCPDGHQNRALQGARIVESLFRCSEYRPLDESGACRTCRWSRRARHPRNDCRACTSRGIQWSGLRRARPGDADGGRTALARKEQYVYRDEPGGHTRIDPSCRFAESQDGFRCCLGDGPHH